MPRAQPAFIAVGLAILAGAGCASNTAGIAPGFSGMAEVNESTYLAINDRKTPRDSGYRFAVIDASKEEGIVISPVALTGIDAAYYPSDLEAICAIPNSNGEFLAAESGFYKGRFGRLMHIGLSNEDSRGWQLRLINQRELRDRPPTEEGTTPKHDEIEGLVCVRHNAQLLIAYCERGFDENSGELHWGSLDLSTLVFQAQGTHDLQSPTLTDNRDCSELHIEDRGESTVSIVAAATFDEDDDNGPFRSTVYRAGTLKLDATSGEWTFSDEDRETIYDVEGLKIEALSSGPSGKSRYAFGTDDENYGGVWRRFGTIYPEN